MGESVAEAGERLIKNIQGKVRQVDVLISSNMYIIICFNVGMTWFS